MDRGAVTLPEYLTFLDGLGLDSLVRLDEERVNLWFSAKPEEVVALRKKAIALLEAAEQALVSQDCPPNAAALRAAELERVRYLKTESWGALWDEQVDLMLELPVTVEARDRLEAMQQRDNDRLEALEGAVQAAAVAYGKAERGERPITSRPPLASSSMPVFVHPNFPPRPSSLSSTQWVAFPLRYSNHLLALHATAIDVLDEWIRVLRHSAAGADPARERLEARAIALRKEARALPSWEGDDSLTTALVADVDEAVFLLGPLAKEYLKLEQKRRKKEAEFHRTHAYLVRLHDSSDRARAFEREVEAFRRRWGVRAHTDWLKGERLVPL